MNGLKRVDRRYHDALARTDWRQVERLLAAYYVKQGWQVIHCGTGASSKKFDGGVDLTLRRDDEYVIVQCKHWNAYQVTHNAVHELLGIMVNHSATGAILITSGEFTAYAIESANKLGHVQLIDGQALRDMLVIDDQALRAMLGPLPEQASEPRLWMIVGGLIFCALIFALLRQTAGTAGDRANQSADAARLPTWVTSAQEVQVVAARRAMQDRMQSKAQQAAPTTDRERKPDPSRPIEPEAARRAVRSVPGVRDAAWVDDSNLLVRVERVDLRTQGMIDLVCGKLAPLGDTLAVVVHLQSAAARGPDDMQSISRNCLLAPGERAPGQAFRSLDVVPAEIREQHKRNNAQRRTDFSQRDEAARRRVLENTPEL